MPKRYSVNLRVNDRIQTYVGSISAELNQEQAKVVAVALNRIFAERGQNWFATTTEELE